MIVGVLLVVESVDEEGKRERTDQVGFERMLARSGVVWGAELEPCRMLVVDIGRGWRARKDRDDWRSAARQWLHIVEFMTVQ